MIGKLVSPLVTVGDSMPGVLVPVFLITFFWSLGIHGDSIVGTIARPLWEVFLANNAEAVVAGEAIPHAAPETFFQWCRLGSEDPEPPSKWSSCVRLHARAIFQNPGRKRLTSIFNINEPVIFGVPIMLNPIMIIPFVVTPLVTSTLSYFATVLGLVTPTYIMPPWTLPAPIGAYLATGGDWRAVVLVVVNVAISFVIYYPFLPDAREETDRRGGGGAADRGVRNVRGGGETSRGRSQCVSRRRKPERDVTSGCNFRKSRRFCVGPDGCGAKGGYRLAEETGWPPFACVLRDC